MARQQAGDYVYRTKQQGDGHMGAGYTPVLAAQLAQQQYLQARDAPDKHANNAAKQGNEEANNNIAA